MVKNAGSGIWWKKFECEKGELSLNELDLEITIYIVCSGLQVEKYCNKKLTYSFVAL